MKKSILYISPGPVYRPRLNSYQDEYRMLSNRFCGHIFTTSSTQEEIDIYDFKYRSMVTAGKFLASFRFFLFCIKNARKIVRGGKKIDLVVTYDPLKSGLIGLVLAKFLGAKFATRVNGVYTSPAEWVDEPRSLQVVLKRNIYPLIMHVVLKHADGIKLLFKTQIDPFKKILSDKVIHCFPNYVDIDAFSNMGEKKEVLFVGFPFKRKGADLVIAAFKMLADKYPDWNLKILGWYPDTTLLEGAIAGHRQIFHQKPVPHNKMSDQIGHCAILVLPSRSEAMGRVLVEAMAAGKPRLASNVDGIPTVINDGVDGLLVEPDNINELAEKLDMLMGNPGLRKSLGLMAQRRAHTSFTKEIYNKNVTNFYSKLLSA